MNEVNCSESGAAKRSALDRFVKWRPLYFAWHGHGGWFRLLGFGLSIINRKYVPEPFSVRIGVRNVLRINIWTISVLYPWR